MSFRSYFTVHPFEHHLVVIPTTCSVSVWSESFNRSGWLTCGENNLFITGFYRSNSSNNTSDPISSLEQARCCNSTPEFSGQNGTCIRADWRNSLERCVFNTYIILFRSISCRSYSCMPVFRMFTRSSRQRVL